MSTPASRIYVCSGVAINNSYAHTIYFESKQAQKRYFANKVVKQFHDYTYLRRNFDIKVEAEITSAQFWNYLFFDNPDGKTYYYFITSVEYKSDTTVVLHLEMDVIQTYMFDWELKPCFIERMTPASDEIGENTIDEGLEVGELTNGFSNSNTLINYYYLMIMTTLDLDDLAENNNVRPFHGAMVGEIYSACGIYCIDPEEYVDELSDLWERISEHGQSEAILAMWMYPKNMIEVGTEDIPLKRVKSCLSKDFYYTVDRTLKDYTPKNNKLLCYPYNFLHVHNNLGTSGDFHFDRFPKDPDLPDKFVCQFKIDGSIFPDGGLKATPANYNGNLKDYEYGITLTGFPTVAWINDSYKIWLAQNQSQMQNQAILGGVSTLAGVGMMLGGLATANPILIGTGATSAFGGFASLSSQMAQIKDMQTTPDQARGAQSASVNASNWRLNFDFTQRCVTPERARIIDDYFTMYGYKQLKIDTPSIHNRTLFTYIKTNSCHVTGTICNDDMRKIASVFDNGVTFWTDGDKIGNYHETNGFLES